MVFWSVYLSSNCVLFSVVISPSLCVFALLSCRRRTSIFCIVCQTSTFFHLTVQVDHRDTINLFTIAFIPWYNFLSHTESLLGSSSCSAHPWLQPLRLSLTCVHLPASCHPTRTITLPSSLFVFPIWPVARLLSSQLILWYWFVLMNGL